MPPNPVAARYAGNFRRTDRVVLCWNALEAKGKANSLVARAPASGPRVSNKTAGELTEEGDDARAMAIVAGKDEQGLATEEADVAMSTRKVNRELERQQQESQESQDMAGVAKMRKACWKLLDKTHRLGEEDERDGLQHYGKDQSGIPLPTRLSGSDAFPTAELQEVMDDHETETWTLGQVFRRTKELKKAVDEGKGFAKKIEEMEREVRDHKSTIAEQNTTIADHITSFGNLKQTNSVLDTETSQLRDELGRAKDELADSISLEEHQRRLDSHTDETDRAKEQAIAELQQKHAEKMADAEERWRDELGTVERSLTSAEEQRSKLESEVTSLKVTLEKSRAGYDMMEKQLQAKLKQDKTAASEDMQRINELVKDKERDCTAALEARDQLQGSLDRERSLREEDQSKIDGLQQSLRDERERHHELQNAHGKQSEEYGRVRDELTHLFKSESQLQQRLAEGEQALAKVQEDKQKVEKDLQKERSESFGRRLKSDHLDYKVSQLTYLQKDSEREIGKRDRQIADLRGEVDKLKNVGQEAHRRAEEETTGLRGVLQGILPVFEGRLPDSLVCENLLKGVCRTIPARAARPVDSRHALGHHWDAGVVWPSELASVDLDESLARRLWLKTCSTRESRPSMVLVEACLLWFWQGQEFTAEDTKFMVAAVDMVIDHCHQAHEAKDEETLSSLALLVFRIMELCIRSGVDRSELQAPFVKVDAYVHAAIENRRDVLEFAMGDWLADVVIRGVIPKSVPEKVLEKAEKDGMDRVWEKNKISPEILIASATRLVLVDEDAGFVAQVKETEVDWTLTGVLPVLRMPEDAVGVRFVSTYMREGMRRETQRALKYLRPEA
ncbi:hypothetical protein KC332_g2028 [Hortaea werneckii]|nr:hypothetical protein KC350_g12615 [Hortaea werneckii]KAI6848050.1 hypothetical protein KC358_g2008 [Hortaea werneckii]KAI6973314.1 hypothetical protein KC329_g12333 [Hortaea werneckii]KAI6974948.1 hypothetical protein KC321_g4831 [Hortaea werneckii]KAI7047682.1 hypothetical protein KC362_g2041 [Hortaea werneckii]